MFRYLTQELKCVFAMLARNSNIVRLWPSIRICVRYLGKEFVYLYLFSLGIRIRFVIFARSSHVCRYLGQDFAYLFAIWARSLHSCFAMFCSDLTDVFAIVAKN